MTDRIPGLLRRPRAVVAAVVTALLVVGVVGTMALVHARPGSDDANGSVPVRSLDDLRGRWVAVNDEGAPRRVVDTVELAVDGDRIVVHTGCNTASGTVVVEGSHLYVEGAGLAVTEMACPDPDLTAQEAWVLRMVHAEPRLELSGPFLALSWSDEADTHRWLGVERQDDPS